MRTYQLRYDEEIKQIHIEQKVTWKEAKRRRLLKLYQEKVEKLTRAGEGKTSVE